MGAVLLDLPDEKRVQHIGGDLAGYGLCGAVLDPNMAGLVATCEACWTIERERSKRKPSNVLQIGTASRFRLR